MRIRTYLNTVASWADPPNILWPSPNRHLSLTGLETTLANIQAIAYSFDSSLGFGS